MQTIDKVFVSVWITMIFILMVLTVTNTYSRIELERSNTINYYPKTRSVIRKEHLVKSSGIDYVEEPDETVDINNKSDLEIREYDTNDCVEREIQIAEPLYGKELYIFYIAQITEQYFPNVDPYIALAVLETESNYIPNLTSSAGAIGLMQVLPYYHQQRIEKYGLVDLWDPYTNILCGIDLLNEVYLLEGNWTGALLWYNRDMRYVQIVLNKADILRKDGYFG